MKSSKNNPDQLLSKLQHRFEAISNPEIALQQQAYMKCEMPYWGIKTPDREKVTRDLFKQFVPTNLEEYNLNTAYLFNYATHREEWYAAVTYARTFKKYIKFESINLYLDMIRTSMWWDIVDIVAARLIGTALLGHAELDLYLDKWIKDPNMWIRRTALLSQLHYKDQTNFALLSKLILDTAREREFFIRKAIGWALRQYSYINPAGVQKFVIKNESVLSGLSKREALKKIQRDQK